MASRNAEMTIPKAERTYKMKRQCVVSDIFEGPSLEDVPTQLYHRYFYRYLRTLKQVSKTTRIKSLTSCEGVASLDGKLLSSRFSSSFASAIHLLQKAHAEGFPLLSLKVNSVVVDRGNFDGQGIRCIAALTSLQEAVLVDFVDKISKPERIIFGNDMHMLLGLPRLLNFTLVRSMLPDLRVLESATRLRKLTIEESYAGDEPLDLAPLSRLCHLRELILKDNGFAASDLLPLSRCTNIRMLTIIEPTVSSLEPLGTLTDLTYLNFRGTTEVSDIGFLRGMRHLTFLNSGDTWRLDDISPMSSLTALRKLNISGEMGSVRDISALSVMTALNVLVCWSAFEDVIDFSPLAHLTQLRILKMGNDSVYMTNISFVTGMKYLHTLAFNGDCNLSDISPLEHVSSLFDLDLCDTTVTDLSSLRNLKELKYLRITNESGETVDLSPLANLPNRILVNTYKPRCVKNVPENVIVAPDQCDTEDEEDEITEDEITEDDSEEDEGHP